VVLLTGFLRQKPVDYAGIRRGDLFQSPKLTLPLRRLLGKDVVTIRLAMFVTLRSAAKPFRGTTVGFEFRHFELQFLYLVSTGLPLEEACEGGDAGLVKVVASGVTGFSFFSTELAPIAPDPAHDGFACG
jgi:hypothetical protein